MGHWAAGTAGDVDHNFNSVYLAHWDGTHWQSVRAPLSQSGLGAELSSISAVSANDVWAVGNTRSSALVEHYTCTR